MSVADSTFTAAPHSSETAMHAPILTQSFAALIVVTSDWLITHITENIGEILDLDASILGHTLDNVLLDSAVHEIRGVLNATAGQNGMGRLLGCDLRRGYPAFDLTVHDVENGYVLEIEPGETVPRIDDIGLIRGLIDRVRQGEALQDVSTRAARSLRALTGFDRVAMCRVDGQGRSGMIAEAQMPGVGSFDIATIAAKDVLNLGDGALKSQFSMTADIDAELVGLVSLPDPPPLDLSKAVSQAPSAEYVAFLRACDAKSAFAVSIVHKGQLIGFIMCHHQKPLRTGFRTRMLVGLFADLFTPDFVLALSDAE